MRPASREASFENAAGDRSTLPWPQPGHKSTTVASTVPPLTNAEYQYDFPERQRSRTVDADFLSAVSTALEIWDGEGNNEISVAVGLPATSKLHGDKILFCSIKMKLWK